MIDARKQEILADIKKLSDMECVHQSGKANALNELTSDIQEDFFTIVVLGEFKRGKSTLVNALLGEKILPTDVLPETATINAIMHSETPTLSVVMRDGNEEHGEVSGRFLKKFSAQNPQAVAEKVKYIKVNDFGAGRLLGDYMRRMGHTRVVFVGVTEKDRAVGVERKDGFVEVFPCKLCGNELWLQCCL